MLAVTTIHEDTYGAEEQSSEYCECSECGATLYYEIDYFVSDGDEHYCRDCAGAWEAERIVKFLGYKNAFDLVYDLKN